MSEIAETRQMEGVVYEWFCDEGVDHIPHLVMDVMAEDGGSDLTDEAGILKGLAGWRVTVEVLDEHAEPERGTVAGGAPDSARH